MNIPGPFKTETRKASIGSYHKRESIILSKYNLILKKGAMKTWSMYSTSIFNLKINFKKKVHTSIQSLKPMIIYNVATHTQ